MLALGAGSVNSQVLFFEDFGGITEPPVGGPYGTPYAYGTIAGGPGTWTFAPGFFLRNVDNLPPNAAVAYVNEAWEIREDFGLSVANACAFSTSWYTPIGTSNDWMWTPLIGPLPANCQLTWLGRAYDPLYPDGYEVRIMASASGPPTGATGVIGNQITNSTVVFSTAAEGTGAWVPHTVSLAAYTGQSIYVGFRNTATDKFILVIDDIKVEAIVNYDANLNFVDTVTEYTLIPKSQVSPLPLNGTIQSAGVMGLTNVGLKVDVYNSSNVLIHTSTSPLTNIAVAGSANLDAGNWTPPNVADTYTLKFYPILTESDGNNLNDTITRTVTITDDTYARDKGAVIGALGIGAGAVGYLGQEFQIHAPARLTDILVYVTQGYTGAKYGAVVWDMAGGYPNSIVAYTDTLLYPDDSADYYTMPMNNGEFILNPGNYAVTMVEFDSTLQVGLTMDIYTPNRTWVDWPTNPVSPWGNNEDYGAGFQRAYVIRPTILPLCPIDIVTATNSTTAGCGLSDGTASVTTTGSGPFTYLWNNGDTTANITGLAVGDYIVVVTDVYSGCTETDTVTVINPNAPSASISGSTNETCAGCNDGTASATASGGTPGYTYSWAPSGGTAASASGLAPGVYTVTVTDAANCSSTATVTINAFNSIPDEIGLYSTQVYPNPSNGEFTISGSIDYSGELKLELINMLGAVVFESVVNVDHQIQSNVQVQVKPGLYILRMTAGLIQHNKDIIIR